MPYTLGTPTPAYTISGYQIGSIIAQGQTGAVAITYWAVDANGNQIPGTQQEFPVPAADLSSLLSACAAAGSLTPGAAYSYLASKLGWAAGTASNG